MICGSTVCGCAFESVGLVITGSGGPGDPLKIEPAGPGIVTTSAAVTTPFLGQTIYEINTGRLKVYDGTNWVIYGGKMPMVSLLGGVVSHVNNTLTDFVLGTEIYDTDAAHSSTNGFFTIPSGLGGKWHVTAGIQYAANASGVRAIRLTVANNGAVSPAEPATITNGGTVDVSNANNGWTIAKPFRLRAAATVTAAGIQGSGGALSTVQMFLTATLIEHEPALV